MILHIRPPLKILMVRNFTEVTGTFHNRLLRWRAPPQTAEQRTTKIENVITFHSRKWVSLALCNRSLLYRSPTFVGYLPYSRQLVSPHERVLQMSCEQVFNPQLNPFIAYCPTSQMLHIGAVGTRQLSVELWLRNCNCSSVPTFFFVLSRFH